MVTLKDLAEAAGILSEYKDKTGIIRETSDDVRRVFLQSMGYKIDTETEREAAYAALKQRKLLPDALPFFDIEPIRLTPDCDTPCNITVADESGKEVWRGTVNPNESATLPALPCGYYNVKAESGDMAADSLMIIAPEKCYTPQFMQDKEHIYGVATMMYALKSENSMGIGDFGCLKELIKVTAANGGDVVGISPLGVISRAMLPSPTTRPLKGDVSPYRTLSRMFINYIYLDLYNEPDFKASAAAQEFAAMPAVAQEIKRLNATENVEYAAVLGIKQRILEMMFDTFLKSGSTERKNAFAAFKEEKGSELENLCLFETLLEHHPEESFWRYWHDGTEDIHSAKTADIKNNNRLRMDFYAYCHWLADTALKEAQQLALSLGMKVGLYGDMPIGAASNGAEVWENPDAYVLGADVGAPPDPMCPCGQSWGFNPYHPLTLAKQHYRPFINLARESMRNVGALRIDHAMGMMRLFWSFFAPGNPIVQGAYVLYDLKALVSILSLESNRSRCLLIGEDLGTVPEGFSEYMAEHVLLSYKDYIQEKYEEDGTCIEPEKYSYVSLAQSSTHDQVTAIGLWMNEDINVFQSCNMYASDKQRDQCIADRRKERENMIKAFAKEGLLTPEMQKEMEETVEDGRAAPKDIGKLLSAFCARSGSAVYLPRLCDIFGQRKMDNAPGIIDEYPNWRLKLPKTIEEICRSEEFATAMRDIKEQRALATKRSREADKKCA